MKSLAIATLTALIFSITCQAADRNIPSDLSGVRGFNYTPANVAASPSHHIDHWLRYSQAVTEFDLNLAKRLKLNQVRVFVPYQVYTADKEGLRRNLVHFVRAAHERGMGVMVVVGYAREWITDTSLQPQSREWAEFLVNTLRGEPGLAFWDVMNEPDWPTTPRERVLAEFEYAKYMAGVFHELDERTPVTIGMAFVPGMEELADYVDVLSYHDYTQTRAQIRANIEEAKRFAAKVGKPLFNTEMGCIARVNPYDVTLQEHMDAGVGWYIWELMIVRRGWGKIHGVFYEDGTVRDPAIAAAILGFFRNRGEDILMSTPDSEGHLTAVLNDGAKWLAQPDAPWSDGLDIAERGANLLEAGQLIAMRDPPTRRVYLMRAGQPDLPALRAMIKEFMDDLEPYKKPQQ